MRRSCGEKGGRHMTAQTATTFTPNTDGAHLHLHFILNECNELERDISEKAIGSGLGFRSNKVLEERCRVRSERVHDAPLRARLRC
jgi:hypothetical protein